MYFRRISALKQHLTEHGLTDQQTFPYLIRLAVTAAAIAIIVGMLLISRDASFVVNALGGLIITGGGLTYCYLRNGGDHGSEFLSRYFSLDSVILERFAIVAAGLIATLPLLHWALPGNPLNSVLRSASFLLWYAAFYLYTARQIHDIVKIRGELP